MRTLYTWPNGLLAFPDDWPEQHYNGIKEPCDMMIGPCACGAWHGLDDPWLVEMLARHNAEIREPTTIGARPMNEIVSDDPIVHLLIARLHQIAAKRLQAGQPIGYSVTMTVSLKGQNVTTYGGIPDDVGYIAEHVAAFEQVIKDDTAEAAETDYAKMQASTGEPF